eukprot:TRINITY_DN10800_c0_g1_i1.p1 TRINITY_DN10800_c0_g1~~TRINITY_DN10800_c0_g1_i1.p1  ORF type:complete len:468 (+),score=110.57 TRINITY_DN10800_c0_g1_i1:234-1637(+)
MGCGSSSHAKPVGYETQEVGSPPKKAGKAPLPTDNVSRVTVEEESDYDSDELDLNYNQRSKSVSRLEAIAKDRDEDEPEMFLWSDFVVDVNQVKKPAPKRNPRQPILWSKKSGTEEIEGTFQFNDFQLTSMDGEEDMIVQQAMLQPRAEIIPKKSLDEYHIRAYEIYSLIGHSARVKCICVSPSEQSFISCSNEDPSMTLCDIHTGKEIMSFMGHDDTIVSACFSSDAKYLATTSRDNTMILWDVTTGKQTLTFEHEKVVISCCFSRDSKLLVSGCQDKVCRIWETKKGREQNSFMEHDGIIISVSFAPDGSSVVSASADKTLKLWRSSDASLIHTMKGHTGIVLSCTFRSDGKYIVSNDERTLKVWDAEFGQCQLSLSVDEVPRPNTQPGKKQTWTLSSYCPGPLGYYIIAACNSKTVHLFHPKSGEEVLALYCKAPVYCLSCGSQSKVAFGDSYGNVFIVTLHAA